MSQEAAALGTSVWWHHLLQLHLLAPLCGPGTTVHSSSLSTGSTGDCSSVRSSISLTSSDATPSEYLQHPWERLHADFARPFN